MEVQGHERKQVLYLHRWWESDHVVAAFNLNDTEVEIDLPIPLGHWQKRFDSSDHVWQADGPSPRKEDIYFSIESQSEVHLNLQRRSFVLFQRES